MPIPKKVAVFNKYVTNRIILPFAGWLPPFAEVTHTGRRSGRVYRTPVLAFATEDGFVVALTYGRDVDWVKNLMRTHGGSIKQSGEGHQLVSVQFICRDEAEDDIPFLVKLLLRLISVEDFIHARAAIKTNMINQ